MSAPPTCVAETQMVQPRSAASQGGCTSPGGRNWSQDSNTPRWDTDTGPSYCTRQSSLTSILSGLWTFQFYFCILESTISFRFQILSWTSSMITVLVSYGPPDDWGLTLKAFNWTISDKHTLYGPIYCNMSTVINSSPFTLGPTLHGHLAINEESNINRRMAQA